MYHSVPRLNRQFLDVSSRGVMNKELRDFIRECDGEMEDKQAQPVSEDDMEAIFRQAKEEHEIADKPFRDKLKEVVNSETSNLDYQTSEGETQNEAKLKRQSRKKPETGSKT